MTRHSFDPDEIERYGLQDFVRLTQEAEAEAELYEVFCSANGLDPRRLESAVLFRDMLDEGGGTEGEDSDGA